MATSTFSGVQRFPQAVPQLHDFLIDSASRSPRQVAVVCGGERLTYAQLDARSNQLASALEASGIRRGDRVLVFLENGIDAVVAFWGVLKANAVVSIASSQTKADKLACLLNDCAAAGLVTNARHARVAAAAASRCASLQVIVARQLARATSLATLPGALDWETATRSWPPAVCPPRRNIDIDLAAIIYTSGSTGEPKGIMLTHRNMITAATSLTRLFGNDARDVILCALPLSFNYGLYQPIMAAQVGARVVVVPSFTYPADVLATIAAEAVTGLPGVPTMFAMMAEVDGIERLDLSSVRYVTNTAAALTPKHVAFIKRAFPAARIHSMFGLTECKRCAGLPPDEIDARPGSVGIAIPNTELWVVDEEGRPARSKASGELVVRGATVMQGYWGKPKETAQSLGPGPIPGERVLHTGDYCRLDEDGYLYFVGRMDQVIKSRGEKVAPEEVERALLSIAGVREAAVVGVPDELLGSAVKAFVVLETGWPLDPRALKRECQRLLEPHMVPTHISFVADLPKTATGKLDRRALTEQEAETTTQAHTVNLTQTASRHWPSPFQTNG